jgi:hypothetical protein
VFAEAKRGTFEITVTAAGELMAEKSVDIMGPVIGRQNNQFGGGGFQGGGPRGFMGGGGGMGHGSDMRVSELKILDIVPEGTIVKQDDYVARLDRTTYDNTLRDAYQTLATERSNLEMAVLDTAVVLTNLRDEIKNQRIAVEESKISLEQSKYEPPATIRQAQLNYEREQRTLQQKLKSYKLRIAQTVRNIDHQKEHVERAAQLVKDLEEFLAQFNITAPAPGMVIYKKERNGSKRKAGSSLNPFDMVVATLPDLASMLSKTFVNEIEVNKIIPGQQVEIVVDAFPKKSYTGTVTEVANIGEKLPNSDEKMFETLIKINGSDPDLRPSMTTGNKIIINKINNVIYIPLECVNTGPDSIPFVYEKKKSRQIVLLGEFNDKNIIVEDGLKDGEIIYAIPPEKAETFKLAGEDLIPVIKERERKKREEVSRLLSNGYPVEQQSVDR